MDYTLTAPPFNTVARIFGENLFRQRIRLRMTQRTLAERSGLSPAYVCELEAGRRNCTVRCALKLAGALGIKLETLCRGIEEEHLTGNGRGR